MIKIVLYILFFIVTVWAMSGLDLNKLFKQSRVIHARIIYLLLAMAIAYLSTNFFYDFFINFQIVK